MKGQTANIVPSIAAIVVVAVLILVGTLVYGYVADVTQQDISVSNESVCGTCIGHTLYELDYSRVLNDSTLICFNNTGTNLLTRGVSANVSGGYRPAEIRAANGFDSINLSYVENLTGELHAYVNVTCSYTSDQATAVQQSFFEQNTSTTYSGFVLATVIVIVLAAVAILMIVLLLRGA